MKYIKEYENLDQKDLKNLIRRLEYNLRKYFGDFNDQFFNAHTMQTVNDIHTAKDCISVYGFNDDITVNVMYWTRLNEKSPKFEAYVNELNRLGIKIWNGYASHISAIQAELLLIELKNKNLYYNALDIEAKKYNL